MSETDKITDVVSASALDLAIKTIALLPEEKRIEFLEGNNSALIAGRQIYRLAVDYEADMTFQAAQT